MRKLILENIRETLKNKVLDKEYIFINKSSDIDVEQLPLITINSISEAIEVYEVSPRSYKRGFNVIIDCLASGNTEENAWINSEILAMEVEQLLESSTFFNGKDRATYLTGIDFEYRSDGDVPIAAASLKYSCEFSMSAIDFSKFCNDVLKQVNIDWKIKDNTTENEVDAQDEITDLYTEGE